MLFQLLQQRFGSLLARISIFIEFLSLFLDIYILGFFFLLQDHQDLRGNKARKAKKVIREIQALR